jgi:hypothetical protein
MSKAKEEYYSHLEFLKNSGDIFSSIEDIGIKYVKELEKQNKEMKELLNEIYTSDATRIYTWIKDRIEKYLTTP